MIYCLRTYYVWAEPAISRTLFFLSILHRQDRVGSTRQARGPDYPPANVSFLSLSLFLSFVIIQQQGRLSLVVSYDRARLIKHVYGGGRRAVRKLIKGGGIKKGRRVSKMSLNSQLFFSTVYHTRLLVLISVTVCYIHFYVSCRQICSGIDVCEQMQQL